MSHSLRGDDAGNVTVAGSAVILAVVASALVVATGVTGMLQSHRATLAADMTALSAATVMQRAGVEEACTVAAAVARDNGAALNSCAPVRGEQTDHGPEGLEGISVTVTVTGRTATAEAGPVQ
ncbi:Rv3654c family TadE-like protein [Corynebacterium sp.]|uniref:Rv3654c family TadE-like protein n=1 Tax=Corynebacterium sp. TaxID=1720 RepID=UPI0025B80A79|nr:Rv3654c family TadE-like protein [Corynebacterium sp.]